MVFLRRNHVSHHQISGSCPKRSGANVKESQQQLSTFLPVFPYGTPAPAFRSFLRKSQEIATFRGQRARELDLQVDQMGRIFTCD